MQEACRKPVEPTATDLDLEPAPAPQVMRAYADAHDILILAHSYQDGEVQEAAHFVGDSLELARFASRKQARRICLCGVHFMAETAKILCPQARVFVPDLLAGCSLADGCRAEDLEKYQVYLKAKLGRSDLVTICYVNCTAGVKALCDIVCTSGNALEVVQSVPADQPILFVPDMHLGSWLNEQTGRNMILWNASCEVHQLFSIGTLLDLKKQHPTAKVLAHPECPKNIRDLSDVVCGTAGMLRLVKQTTGCKYIIATEANMIYRFRKEAPGNEYIAAPGPSCACNLCPHMQRNTPDKLWHALQTMSPEVNVPEDVAARARRSVQRMLDTRPKVG
jgi:quinolinate synthase